MTNCETSQNFFVQNQANIVQRLFIYLSSNSWKIAIWNWECYHDCDHKTWIIFLISRKDKWEYVYGICMYLLPTYQAWRPSPYKWWPSPSPSVQKLWWSSPSSIRWTDQNLMESITIIHRSLYQYMQYFLGTEYFFKLMLEI